MNNLTDYTNDYTNDSTKFSSFLKPYEEEENHPALEGCDTQILLISICAGSCCASVTLFWHVFW